MTIQKSVRNYTHALPSRKFLAYLVIGANGIVRGKKVTSLARWPPNPSRCWALTWRTIGPMEDYWARSGGLLAEWPLSTSGGVFPLTRLTTDA